MLGNPSIRRKHARKKWCRVRSWSIPRSYWRLVPPRRCSRTQAEHLYACRMPLLLQHVGGNKNRAQLAAVAQSWLAPRLCPGFFQGLPGTQGLPWAQTQQEDQGGCPAAMHGGQLCSYTGGGGTQVFPGQQWSQEDHGWHMGDPGKQRCGGGRTVWGCGLCGCGDCGCEGICVLCGGIVWEGGSPMAHRPLCQQQQWTLKALMAGCR